MIKLLNARMPVVGYREAVSFSPRSTIPHLPAAVQPETIKRFETAAGKIAQRWGVAAASSLLAELAPRPGADEDFLIAVVSHGPIEWVASGDRMMRPFLPTTWFVVGQTWQALPLAAGVTLQLKAAPDACLAHPTEVLAAVQAATHARVFRTPAELLAFRPNADPALQALALSPHAAGRTIVALGWCAGCLGPLAVDVDSGEVSLDTRVQEPWEVQYLE